MTTFAGTGQLVRLALRRDRIMVPAWLVALVLTLYSSVASTVRLYPSEQAREQLAAGIADNPAVIALYGPVTDLSTLGGLATWKPNTILAVLIALMSTFLVVRHTRADEETGRLELVGAGVVGRHAALTAAIVVAAGTNVAMTALMLLSLLGQGLPTSGIAALTLGYGAVGLVFTAVAAVAAQLTESSRTANGIAVTVLAAAFLLRAAGDSAGEGGPSWLSWLSPIGWVQKAHPFGDLHWWPLLLPLGFAVLATATAYRFAGRRDLAAGLLPPRPGPARASGWLRTSFALAWRLQRGALLGWAVGFAVLGGVLGSIASTIGDVLGDQGGPISEMLQRIGGTRVLTDAYLGTSMGIAALVATAFAVQATLRLRGEEAGQRVEPLLSTRVGRIPWALSHAAIAVLGPAVLLGVAGLAAGLAHGARVGDVGGQLPRLLGAALVQLPAVWVVVGITLALFGLVPRLATAGWGILVAFLLLSEVGPTLKLDQRLLDLSPFVHTPHLPAAPLTLAPLLALTAVAVVLAATGLVGLRRRDIG
jgi:ABC-2 type transport system permease protein